MKEYNIIKYLTIFISIFGIIIIYSASSVWATYLYHNAYKFMINQAIFFIIGLILMKVISKINIDYLKKYSNHLLIISLILLILVLIPGIGMVRNGSRSWFGVMGFGIQPSELCKLVLIIYTAKYLSYYNNKMNHLIKGTFPILLVIGIFFFLIMLEPDLGSGAVIVLTLITMLFISNIKLSLFINFGLIGLGGLAGLIVIAPYRLKRIVSFLNPWSDPLGSGFQIIQSLYAIGPNGLFGRGLGNSIQKHFYLPEPQTDFIFSIISEEFGFVGVLIVTLIYLTIFYEIIKVSLRQTDMFKKYLSFGLGFSIIFQAFLNLAVVTGLIPVTGVTLPFLSYGGSSLLISLCSIGIILNIARYQR